MDIKIVQELFLLIQKTIESMQPVIWHIRRQNYFGAMTSHSKLLKNVTETAELLLPNIETLGLDQNDQSVVSTEHLLYIIGELNKAQKDNDYILLADLYELMMLPMLCGVQGHLMQISGGFVCDDSKYTRTMERMKNEASLNEAYDILKEIDPVEYIHSSGLIIEPIASGHAVIAVNIPVMQEQDKKYYIHSNSDVFREALLLASYWYDEQIEEYIIYGLGLGYHIQALADMSAYTKIKVYESNAGIICSAAAFGILLELMERENIEIIFDNNFSKLNKILRKPAEHSLFLVHSPSLHIVNEIQQREAMEAYGMQYHSMKVQKKYLDGNFKRNIKLYDALADTLHDKLQGKDIYLIAAGPSLDKNVHQLKAIIENTGLRKISVIIAVGTVFGKLLQLGIIPDYIVASDAKPGTYNQIKGLEGEIVPLIGLSTLYYEFFQNYKGKKYIVFQEGYAPAENKAKNLESRVFETGGSVITTAFDVALKLGCRRLILLGVDFAYTNGELHASGTHRSLTVIEENMIYIKDIYGNHIATGKNLNIYRKWIEKKITEYGKGRVIDATEGGAYIEGTKVKSLQEVIEEVSRGVNDE